MSLSTCEHCGGHIPLGPDASNRCEVRAAYGIPDGVPIVQELDRRFEKMESLLEIAWKALDDWSGDIELTRAEGDALADAWEKIGDWRGWKPSA